MPHLTSLSLAAEDKALEQYLAQVVQQLAAGHNKSLRKLTTTVRFSPAVARALPQLEELEYLTIDYPSSGKVPMSIIEHLPSSLTSLRILEEHGYDTDLDDALIKHPLPQLQRLDRFWPSPTKLRQLLSQHTHLTSIEIAVDDGVAIAAELQSAAQLTQLSICNIDCTAELTDALCGIPKLTHLTIQPNSVLMSFWQSVPRLRQALIDHLPANQRHQHAQLVQLNITGGYAAISPSERNDECYLALIRASWLCNRFEVSVAQTCIFRPRVSEAAWQRLVNETANQTSVLQHSDTHNFAELPILNLMHSNITDIYLSTTSLRGVNVSQILAVLLRLQALACWYLPVADLRQGLTTSGALRTIQRLDLRLPWSTDQSPLLLQRLELVRDCVSLQHALLTALVEEWANLQLSDIRAYTKHLTSVAIVTQRTPEQSRHAAVNVACSLLLLRNLTELSLTERYQLQPASSEPGTLGCCEVARIRRHAALNSVQYSCDWSNCQPD